MNSDNVSENPEEFEVNFEQRLKNDYYLVVRCRVVKIAHGFPLRILIMGGVVLRGEGVVDVCAG